MSSGGVGHTHVSVGLSSEAGVVVGGWAVSGDVVMLDMSVVGVVAHSTVSA